MKVNILLTVIFLSITLIAGSGLLKKETKRIGGTQLNGSGCICHSFIADPSVKVWIQGPDTLAVGQTGYYRMFMAGGPAEAGGYNVAGRFGIMSTPDSFSVFDTLASNELTQAFPLIFPSPYDTIYWGFHYTVNYPVSDTIYSVGLSVVHDTIPNEKDKWAFGPKFPVRVISAGAPLINSSFPAKDTIITSSDSLRFYIEASDTNNLTLHYRWRINGETIPASSNSYLYLSGSTNSLYDTVEVSVSNKFYSVNKTWIVKINPATTVQNINVITEYSLEQNFPNPFNPATTITFKLPNEEFVELTIYNSNGEKINELVKEVKPAGIHTVNFNGQNLSSGIYFYRIKTGKFTATKKLLLLK